ncbi:MAG: radical SAM family heme chaperone HemW [Lachnospiraceae bacterium]|nr:radical SAM family heme chaperone HemW [Lachnospiraceae bacterium]
MSKELSLYIHIPFCVKKCLYCDFLSAPASVEVQEKYLSKLCEEIRRKAPEFQEYQVKTIFFGGGTPTAVQPESLCKVLETLYDHFSVAPDAEISLECNPGTASLRALQSYRKAGFNRISIGLQSADDGLLRRLGRIHTYEQFLQTFGWAREAGFENINVDLMSSLPGQTLEQYEDTLYRVLALKPEHISAYSLIVEEGTPFASMELDTPSEELDRLMYQRTEEILNAFGYERYEISNYALPGRECRHNLVYWQRGAYLGLGLGASSFYDHTRYKNVSDLSVYLDGERSRESNEEKTKEYEEEYEEKEALTPREEMEEFYFLGLRLMRGVSQSAFRAQFGEDAEGQFEGAIESSIADGLMERTKDGERLCLTKRGIDLSNAVFVRFLE